VDKIITDQDLIAKQAAIIQAQEILINSLKYESNNIENSNKELQQEISIVNVLLNMKQEYILKLKKRPKFIMIINRRKK
jgi:hypothetical protein